jgi:type II secretion system protein D
MMMKLPHSQPPQRTATDAHHRPARGASLRVSPSGHWLALAAGLAVSMAAMARVQDQPATDPPQEQPAEAPKAEPKPAPKPEVKKAEPEPEAPPQKPEAKPVEPSNHSNGDAPKVKAPPKEYEIDALGRRIVKGQTTTLAFKSVTVERIIPFIVESTGKVVLPQQEIMSRKITIINDSPLPQGQALDLVFLALQQNGVAVVETKDRIMLRDIAEIVRQDVPVIAPDQSTLERTDLGTIAEKVYALRNSSAKSVGEALKDAVPDYAKLVIEEESNQVVVRGNIGLLQRMEKLIQSLDRPSATALQTATYRLRYADADQVATNIKDLFEENRQSQQAQQNRGGFNPFGGGGNNPFGGGGNQGGGRGNNQGGQGNRGNNAGGNNAAANQPGSVAPSGNLRVSSNKQQNSVTVLGEPGILEQIRKQVEEIWDQPLSEAAVVPRIYDLKNSDPVKVQNLLEGLFGTAGSGNSSAQQGIGRLAGQFSFQAIPEAGRLVVISKSPDNMFVIDEIIKGIDQPQGIGLPEVVELKHANSEELAQQLNALLSQEGTLAQIDRSESGLSDSSSSTSPFATTQQSATTDSQGNTTQQSTTTNAITFWWQRARVPTDNQGSSNLVGKIRIVPVWRQNAVMVLAPTEYRTSVVQLIQAMDKPGRQVLISAVVAEISSEDATNLGLRWSSQAITPANTDNSISVGTTTTATENRVLGNLFDTSVLNVNADVNVILQALNQKTGVSILSEPKIFTSDNQEAEFFDGQDIPFITQSQTNQQGNVVQSFDYRAVGIQLRIRPRITINRDVDLRVNLELSSIQPQQTLFGGFVVDRRETTTQLVVKDGQTIVISGILRTEDSDIKRKIPLLGDIPLIGLLFQSTDKTKRQTELVTFITPLVVDNTEKLDEVNEQPRARLKELRKELGNHDGKGEKLPDLTPGDGSPGSGLSPASGESPEKPEGNSP